MYVRPGTTWKQIQKMIEQTQWELDHEILTESEREFLYEELDYLESFRPKEEI